MQQVHARCSLSQQFNNQQSTILIKCMQITAYYRTEYAPSVTYGIRVDVMFSCDYSLQACMKPLLNTHTHARTHECMHAQPFYGPLGFCPGLSGWASTRKVKPGRQKRSGFTTARDSEWQWHQLGHIQICTLTQIHDHVNISQHGFYRPDALPAAQPTASKQQLESAQRVHISAKWILYKITGLKDIRITTLNSEGHVTSSMTSSVDLP